jgi:hypothetical protein
LAKISYTYLLFYRIIVSNGNEIAILKGFVRIITSKIGKSPSLLYSPQQNWKIPNFALPTPAKLENPQFCSTHPSKIGKSQILPY